MRRTLYTPEHEAFRLSLRDYLHREVVPEFPKWNEAGQAPRNVLRDLAKLGITGFGIPEEFGGVGDVGYLYNAVIIEECARAVVVLGSVRVHTDVVVPYFLEFCNDEQRRRWFPRLAVGDMFGAIAMTEPGTGSDLAGIRTTAVRDGDEYVLNGAKTFITGGVVADTVLVVCRTSEAGSSGDRRSGLSLIVVEEGTPGFVKGRKLEKLGLAVQDTAELAFTDVRVPIGNLLGEEGRAFWYLSHNLPQERLSIATNALCQASAALELTIEYTSQRTVFGKSVASFQNTKFELASVATEIEAGQAMVDRALVEHETRQLSAVDAAKVKLFCTELQARAVDRCLQLFGGYGYMTEYPIARLYADARVSRIYGGTTEVLKTIISKSLGV